MNITSFTAAMALGFVVPVILMDIGRHLLAGRWPAQEQGGFRLERRALPWLLAVFAGPAILWERTRHVSGRGWGSRADVAMLYVLIAIWSCCYGVLAWSAASGLLQILRS